MKQLGDALQVVNGATGLSTVAYKVIDIKSSGIEVKTRQLPGFSGFAGDIVCPDRSTDKTHESIDIYHWGSDEERGFTITFQLTIKGIFSY